MNTKALPFILAALVCAAVLIAEEQRIGGLRQSLALLQRDSAAAQEQMNGDAAELKKLRERNAALASRTSPKLGAPRPEPGPRPAAQARLAQGRRTGTPRPAG